MLDNELISILIAYLTTQMSLLAEAKGYNMPPPLVCESQPPTQGGAPDEPTILIHKISDERVGSPGVYTSKDDDENVIKTTVQTMATMYQIGALYIQVSTDTTQLTAGDILNMAAEILQDPDTVNYLEQTYGIGVLKVVSEPQPYFTDDMDRQEADPRFEFTVSHKNTTIKQVNKVSTIESGIYRV